MNEWIIKNANHNLFVCVRILLKKKIIMSGNEKLEEENWIYMKNYNDSYIQSSSSSS